jgi:hypothetical protein
MSQSIEKFDEAYPVPEKTIPTPEGPISFSNFSLLSLDEVIHRLRTNSVEAPEAA